MNLPGALGELNYAGFGVTAASAAQVGPPVLAQNDVGVCDIILGYG